MNHLDILAQLSSRGGVGGEGFCIWISGDTVQSIAQSKVVKVKGWSHKHSNHQFGGGTRIIGLWSNGLSVKTPGASPGSVWSRPSCSRLYNAILEKPAGSQAWGSFPSDSVLKNLPARARDEGSIPRSRRSPGEGNGSPLKYPCLGNLMDRGAWQATVPGVTKNWDRT